MPRSAWLAIGAVVAASVGALLDIGSIGGAVVALIALACLAIAPWTGRRPRAPLVASAIGALAIGLRLASTAAPPPEPASVDGDGPWAASVTSIGSPRDGDQVGMLRVTLDDGGAVLLAATLPRYPAIEAGDLLTIEGRARPRPDSDYGRYLERIGAWGTLDVDALAVAAVGAADPGRALERVRRAAGDALAAVLPEPEAGLAAGILIGLRDRVDRVLAADFTTAGASHVVAISGWNIAIVASVIGALAGRLGRRRRAVVTVLAILAYVVFAGASASVLRAGVMAGVVLLARESGRPGRAAAALGWAVALLLLADPDLVADAGFQLSSLATAGLIAWATPLTGWLERLGRGRLPRWLAESLGVSFAAQAATLPVVLAAFGRLALISPVVNLLIVPLVAPAMAVGVVALIGGVLVGMGAPPALGAVLALPGWVSLRVIAGIVGVAADVPGASLEIEAGGRIVAAVIAVAAVALAVAWGRRRTTRTSVTTARARPTARGSRAMRLASIVLIGTMAVTTAIIVSKPAGSARITVLDVGQGDAILVEGSAGGRLLIDGGPDPDRLLVELDRRIPPWDRRIDAVILSHPHEDHVAGLALLLDRYRVGRVFEPGMRGPGPGYRAWGDRLARDGAPARAGLAAGDRLAVDEIEMTVLWPIRGEVPDEPPDDGTGINNVSVVLLGSVAGRRFLLTGDVEDGVDPRLLAAGLPRVDLLKIAHHGSRTATTQAFVDSVAPRVAVASAGSDNPYGHPARPTLERLEAAGARVYRTDRDGSVRISFRAEGLVVETDPSRQARSAPRVAAAAATDRAANPSFWCAVPLGPGLGAPGLGAAREGAAAATSASLRAASGRDAGHGAFVGYHRHDDGPLPGGGREPAVFPGSPSLVPRARVRGGGRGRLAGPTRGGQWHRHRSSSGGGGGPPARRGQAPARRRSGARPAPR